MIFKGCFGTKLDDEMKLSRKTSVRAVVSQNQKYLMILTNRGDLIFPGGGVEFGESNEEAVARELLEETGYHADGEILYIGQAITRRQDKYEDKCMFEANMYFYKCNITGEQVKQNLSAREMELNLLPKWLSKEEIIDWNRNYNQELEHSDVWVEMTEFVLNEID